MKTVIALTVLSITLLGCQKSNQADAQAKPNKTTNDQREPRSIGGAEKTEISGHVVLPSDALFVDTAESPIHVWVAGSKAVETIADAEGNFKLQVPNALVQSADALASSGNSSIIGLNKQPGIALIAAQANHANGIRLHIKDIIQGQPYDAGALTLAAYGTLKGFAKLYDRANNPAPSHAAIVVGPVDSVYQTTTLEDGAYALPVPAGEWTLTASKQGFRALEQITVHVLSDETTQTDDIALVPTEHQDQDSDAATKDSNTSTTTTTSPTKPASLSTDSLRNTGPCKGRWPDTATECPTDFYGLTPSQDVNFSIIRAAQDGTAIGFRMQLPVKPIGTVTSPASFYHELTRERAGQGFADGHYYQFSLVIKTGDLFAYTRTNVSLFDANHTPDSMTDGLISATKTFDWHVAGTTYDWVRLQWIKKANYNPDSMRFIVKFTNNTCTNTLCPRNLDVYHFVIEDLGSTSQTEGGSIYQPCKSPEVFSPELSTCVESP